MISVHSVLLYLYHKVILLIYTYILYTVYICYLASPVRSSELFFFVCLFVNINGFH